MLGSSLPSLPIRPVGAHPAPHSPGRILPRPYLAPARLSGRQTQPHVARTCVPTSPCWRTNSSFGFGLILLKGKAAKERLSLKPFPAIRQSGTGWPGAADLVHLRRSIICFSRGNPAELCSAPGASLPGGGMLWPQGGARGAAGSWGGLNGCGGGKGWAEHPREKPQKHLQSPEGRGNTRHRQETRSSPPCHGQSQSGKASLSHPDHRSHPGGQRQRFWAVSSCPPLPAPPESPLRFSSEPHKEPFWCAHTKAGPSPGQGQTVTFPASITVGSGLGGGPGRAGQREAGSAGGEERSTWGGF